MRYLNEYIIIQFIVGNLESMRSMSDRFDVSKSSFHKSIKRTGSALCKIMPDIIKWPSNAIQVNKTCRLFAERSQFQNILGAIDGSHIHITAPKHLHQAYFNRKGFYSIVLLASCDATLAFNYVWTGNPGSTHDSTVLRQSDLFAQSNERIPIYQVGMALACRFLFFSFPLNIFGKLFS